MIKSLVLIGAVLSTGLLPSTLSAAESAQSKTEASPSSEEGNGCRVYNKRIYGSVGVYLWKCDTVPGSHGPMYHAEAYTNPNSATFRAEVVQLRYRSNGQLIDSAFLSDGQLGSDGLLYQQTRRYYANPGEVQACARVWYKLPGGEPDGQEELICAWE